MNIPQTIIGSDFSIIIECSPEPVEFIEQQIPEPTDIQPIELYQSLNYSNFLLAMLSLNDETECLQDSVSPEIEISSTILNSPKKLTHYTLNNKRHYLSRDWSKQLFFEKNSGTSSLSSSRQSSTEASPTSHDYMQAQDQKLQNEFSKNIQLKMQDTKHNKKLSNIHEELSLSNMSLFNFLNTKKKSIKQCKIMETYRFGGNF